MIEEIETVGRSEEHGWTSQCAHVIRHMLKIEHYREATIELLERWEQEIQDFREEMSATIVDNPSLQTKYPTMFAKAMAEGQEQSVSRIGSVRC